MQKTPNKQAQADVSSDRKPFTEDLRGFVERLRKAGQLIDLHNPVDIRHVATLVAQSDKALMFHNVIGYKMPLLSGILRSKERVMMSLDCADFRQVEDFMARGMANPIAPTKVATSETEDILITGDDVDLFSLPVPVVSVHDGGPMITAGIVMARDPEYGIVNTGCYRFMIKERNLTGIDIVTPNNLRHYAERAYKAGRSLPISISIGTHPIEMIWAAVHTAIDIEEMTLAGGSRGAGVPLGQCKTCDLPYIAGSEIVLEGEILPTGWTEPEGRFGEFTYLMGGLHWNPNVKINAIQMRRDAMYYSLHMPLEVTYLSAVVFPRFIRRALQAAGINVVDINVTIGGSAYWHAIISIRKQPGDGKVALLAALSVSDLKHVVVVDDDIDVNNATDVEWAIATRVQGDRDIIIAPGARAKPLDPSLYITHGTVPTGARVGIDATIGEGIPKERFERITYAYGDTAKIADYVKGKSDPKKASQPKPDKSLKKKIVTLIENGPMYYSEIDQRLSEYDYPTIARAIGQLHAENKLWKDPVGRICLRGSEFDAKLR